MSFYELFLEVEYWKGERLTRHEAKPVILRDLAKKDSRYYVVGVDDPAPTNLELDSLAIPINNAIRLRFDEPYLAVIKFNPLFFHTVFDLANPPNTFWLKHLHWKDLMQFLEKSTESKDIIGYEWPKLKRKFNKIWKKGNSENLAEFIRDVLDYLPSDIRRKALKEMDVKAIRLSNGFLQVHDPDPRYIKIVKVVPKGTALSRQMYTQGFRQKPTETAYIVYDILRQYRAFFENFIGNYTEFVFSEYRANKAIEKLNSFLQKLQGLKNRKDYQEITSALAPSFLLPLQHLSEEIEEDLPYMTKKQNYDTLWAFSQLLARIIRELKSGRNI